MNTIGLQSIAFIVGPTMFQTESHARHRVMSALAGEDQHVWTYVVLTDHRPWFFASYTFDSPEGNIAKTKMMSSIEQVLDLINQREHLLALKSLMLVSPPHLNDSKSWLMEPLGKIWKGREKTIGHDVFVYDLANGKRYVDWFAPLEVSQLGELRCEVAFGE